MTSRTVDWEASNREAARAFKDAGGRVVGFLCDNVPAELIAASGALPFRVGGNGGNGFGAVDELVRANRDHTRGPVPGFVDAIVEGLLQGHYDLLDLLIVPHNRKALQRIPYELRKVPVERTEGRLPQFHYLDRSYSTGFLATSFNERQVDALRDRLELLTGAPITGPAIAEAVRQADEGRALMRQLAALRSGSAGPRISGTEALAIQRDFWQQDRRTFNAGLSGKLAEIAEAPVLAGPRIFLAGSPQDQSGACARIEAAGAVVVGEDHCWGGRCAEWGLGHPDPYAALRRRYASQPSCASSFPLRNATAASLARFAASGAQAIVAAVARGDVGQAWQVPEVVRDARARGIPVLHLVDQPYGDIDEVAVAGFVATLDRGAAA